MEQNNSSSNFELNIIYEYSKNPRILSPEEYCLGPTSLFSWDRLSLQVNVPIFSSCHPLALNAFNFLHRAIELSTHYLFPKLQLSALYTSSIALKGLGKQSPSV